MLGLPHRGRLGCGAKRFLGSPVQGVSCTFLRLPPWGRAVRDAKRLAEFSRRENILSRSCLMRGSHSQNGVSTAQNEAAQTDAYASYPSSTANAVPLPPRGKAWIERYGRGSAYSQASLRKGAKKRREPKLSSLFALGLDYLVITLKTIVVATPLASVLAPK